MRKKKIKNFGRFREFALHYESTESEESSENFVLVANKSLVCHFPGLKQIFLSVKSAKNFTSTGCYLKDNNRCPMV